MNINTLSNYLQLVGVTFDFIGFLILFFNSYFKYKSIDTKNIFSQVKITSNRFLGGGDLDRDYTRWMGEEIVNQVNERLKLIVDKFNSHTWYTALSWFCISVGFLFEGFGIYLQL